MQACRRRAETPSSSWMAIFRTRPTFCRRLIAAWRGGAQVVTAVRKSRKESRKALALLFPLFYRVMGAISDYPIPLNAGIFGLLDRAVLDSLNNLREGNRYLPGLRAWVGYRTAIVYYDRQDRIGGEGKLSFVSRIKYAMDAITSFSYKPLRLSFVLAAMGFLATGVLGAVALVSPSRSMEYGLFAAVSLMGTLPLFCIGILGEYLGRVYDEVETAPALDHSGRLSEGSTSEFAGVEFCDGSVRTQSCPARSVPGSLKRALILSLQFY